MEILDSFSDYHVNQGPVCLEDIKVLYGANYFSGGPIIRFRINLADYMNIPSNKIEGFFEKLKELLPTLYNHHCSVGKPGGFFQRVKEGTLLGHIMEHVAIELQNLAGMDVGFGKTRETKIPGVYNVVFRYIDEIAGIYAGKAALNLINSILQKEIFEVAPIVKNLILIREKRLLGPSTQAIVSEAQRRKIPVIRHDKYNQVQLGTGKYRKRIRATLTDQTSVIAVETTDDKYVTSQILQENGIPVPLTILTTNLDEVIQFFEKIQKSIIIKPAMGYQGKRVSIGLSDTESIKKAFSWAQEFDEEVIVQEDIAGGTYRILVINYKFVAAVRLVPAYIIGDGISTVNDLIEKINSEPEREFGDKGVLSKVEFDEETLKIIELRGFAPESVLPKNEIIFLKNSGNMKLGATSIDVTDQVHVYNRFLAERISALLNLNVAGIDLISEDIKVPANQNNGKVIEVNSAPDFRMHFNPTIGIKRYVQREFVSMLFPQNSQSRIPIFSVTGSKGKSLAVRIIEAGLKSAGKRTGVVSKYGLYVSDFCLKDTDATDQGNVEIVLKDPTIDCAVIETPVETILNSGLGYEYASFGILLNLYDAKKEYYNYDHIRDIEDVAYAKFVVPEQVYEDGFSVLNADVKVIMDIRDRIYNTIALFSKNPNSPTLIKHIHKQGYAATIKNNFIVIFDKDVEISVINIQEILFLKMIEEEFKYDALLAAIIALYLYEIPIENIRKVLLEFSFSDVFL